MEKSRISADLLYTLTGLIAARTPAEKRSELFGALLRRVEDRTSHPPRVHLTKNPPPQDIAESVGRCVYAAMGDMDRRVRWRACHAALVLLRGQDPAWDKLVSCLLRNEEPVFAGAPFYRYAALEQLMTLPCLPYQFCSSACIGEPLTRLHLPNKTISCIGFR